MSDKKNKKKTLTISTNLTKKIDISSLSRDGKKAFSIDKKKPYRPTRDNKSPSNTGNFNKPGSSRQNIVRKFVEQQYSFDATYGTLPDYLLKMRK